jgi:hypothetical protein
VRVFVWFVLGIFCGVAIIKELHHPFPFLDFASGLVFGSLVKLAIAPVLKLETDQAKQMYEHARLWAAGIHLTRSPIKCQDCKSPL